MPLYKRANAEKNEKTRFFKIIQVGILEKNLFFSFFVLFLIFIFWLCHVARGILVCQPEIEPTLPALKS